MLPVTGRGPIRTIAPWSRRNRGSRIAVPPRRTVVGWFDDIVDFVGDVADVVSDPIGTLTDVVSDPVGAITDAVNSVSNVVEGVAPLGGLIGTVIGGPIGGAIGNAAGDILGGGGDGGGPFGFVSGILDTVTRSEEHTSELQSLR